MPLQIKQTHVQGFLASQAYEQIKRIIEVIRRGVEKELPALEAQMGANNRGKENGKLEAREDMSLQNGVKIVRIEDEKDDEEVDIESKDESLGEERLELESDGDDDLDEE